MNDAVNKVVYEVSFKHSF